MTFENRKSSLVADINHRDNIDKMSMRHKKNNPLYSSQITPENEDVVSLGQGIEGLDVRLEGIPEAPAEDCTNKNEANDKEEPTPFSF